MPMPGPSLSTRLTPAEIEMAILMFATGSDTRTIASALGSTEAAVYNARARLQANDAQRAA